MTDKNAFTPGPWVKDFQGTKGHIKSVAPHSKGWTPTVAYYDTGTYDSDGVKHCAVSDEEIEANGELIAKAPEMYAEIARLRAENEHLKAWLEIRSEIIEGADANRESWRKEAVRLKAEKARLTAELENWRKRGASVVANVAGLVKEVDRLAADKEKLVEALKTIVGKSRGDSVAAHVAVAVIKEVQHD